MENKQLKEKLSAIEHNELVIKSYQKLFDAYNKENLTLDYDSVQYCLNQIQILKISQTIKNTERLLEHKKLAYKQDYDNFYKAMEETNKNFDTLLNKVKTYPKYKNSARIKKLLSIDYDLNNQEHKNNLYAELKMECDIIEKAK